MYRYIGWGMLLVLVGLLFWRYQFRGAKGLSSQTQNQLAQHYAKIESLGIGQENFELHLRAFKRDKELEVWVKAKEQNEFKHLLTYPICKNSGELGPKRKEGDRQVPEGFYHIDRMNPRSSFHLSMGLNYPNASDKIRGDQAEPGSDIFIHGGCVTVGCIPITNKKIEELYTLVTQAQNNGQAKVPVHVFPARMDKASFLAHYDASPHQGFWKELLPVYQYFETHHRLPEVEVSDDGAYVLVRDPSPDI